MNSFEERKEFGPRMINPLPWQGWVGLLLIAICWPLNWTLPGLRTHLLFFPLWLGYIFVVDALTVWRTGTSLITRSPRDFTLLFLVSVPAWWLFEVLNWRTGNWQYLGRDMFTNLQYFLYQSLCFSTVMPAVFGTAELVRSFGWIDRFAHRKVIVPTKRMCIGLFICGMVMLSLMLLWPLYFFPFMWGSLFFMFEPLCVWLGRHSIFSGISRGDWRTVLALAVAALICGFFWEMWNYFAYPKWIYHVPFVGFWHIFEMPLLGYGGYPPFALDLYALLHLVLRRPPQLRV